MSKQMCTLFVRASNRVHSVVRMILISRGRPSGQ
jgi:hypothetical protein